MCEAFAQIGINTTLVIPEREKSEIKVDNFVENKFNINSNFKIYETDIFPEASINKYVKTAYLDEIFSDFKANIYFVRTERIMFPCVNKGLPVVYENHDCRIHTRFLMEKFYTYRLKNIARCSNLLKIVTINKRLKNYWIAKGISEEKIFSYHDGFAESNYQPSVSTPAAREKLNMPKDEKIVVYTGSLDHGIDSILLNLIKKFPKVTFYIVGGPGAEARKIRKEVKNHQLSKVYVIGRIPHRLIPEYHFAADVLLAVWTVEIPTIESMSPMKVFEYMAAGKIIVAHAFPTIKEVLKDGFNSLLADPYSFNDLVNKLKAALQMSYPNEIAENARKDAFEKYTWKRRAKEIINSMKTL